MQLNVLNDLAEAKRRWTEKKQRKRNKALQTKTTGKEQMIKTYGERAACRSACMDFRGASMQLQLHNLKANPNH